VSAGWADLLPLFTAMVGDACAVCVPLVGLGAQLDITVLLLLMVCCVID